MSAAIAPADDTLGAGMRQKLAGFARTLRDNGFKVGLTETGDALAILASPAAARPATLKGALKALFCATRSEWERFDEIFAAYWLGRHMRRAQLANGTPAQSRAAQRRTGPPGPPPLGAPDQAEQRDDDAGDAASRRGRREGASRAELLATTDLRHIVDPDDVAAAHALAARLARAMRARMVRRYFLNDTATRQIYTLSLHAARP